MYHGNKQCDTFHFSIDLLVICFEIDIQWGRMTLSFIFLPGLVFGALVGYGLYKQPADEKDIFTVLKMLLTPLLIPLFPILFILVKFVSIFHHGEKWKKLDELFTLCEGQIESSLQTALQTYIIFYRFDRPPSMIQMMTLPFSVLMLIKGQIEYWYKRDTTEVTWKTKIFRILKVGTSGMISYLHTYILHQDIVLNLFTIRSNLYL